MISAFINGLLERQSGRPSLIFLLQNLINKNKNRGTKKLLVLVGVGCSERGLEWEGDVRCNGSSKASNCAFLPEPKPAPAPVSPHTRAPCQCMRVPSLTSRFKPFKERRKEERCNRCSRLNCTNGMERTVSLFSPSHILRSDE